MRATKNLAAAAALVGLFAASASQANFYYLDTQSPTGASSPIALVNDFRTNLASAGVSNMYLGRSLAVSGTVGRFVIDVDFFAAEAAYRNQFIVGSTTLIDNQGNRSWTERDIATLSPTTTGRMNLQFCAVSVGCMTNYDNDRTGANSVQSIGMWLTNGGNTAWLLWDDSGAGPDDNHDDMIVRLTYRSVPEPGTLALMGLGLVGVALFRRKKAQAA